MLLTLSPFKEYKTLSEGASFHPAIWECLQLFSYLGLVTKISSIIEELWNCYELFTVFNMIVMHAVFLLCMTWRDLWAEINEDACLVFITSCAMDLQLVKYDLFAFCLSTWTGTDINGWILMWFSFPFYKWQSLWRYLSVGLHEVSKRVSLDFRG
jgi:hypothetical protein